MNWITIFGAIIILIGTLIMTYGNQVSSFRSNEEIQKQITAFSGKFDHLKEVSPTKSMTNEVQILEDEFNTWAKKFTQDKQIKKVEAQKEALSVKEKEIELNEKYGVYYKTFFYDLKSYLKAYNEQATPQLIYDIPDFPQNLFPDINTQYIAKIKFRDKLIWKFAVDLQTKKLSDDRLPTINLVLSNKYEDEKLLRLPEIIFVFDIGRKKIRIVKMSSEVSIGKQLKDEYPLDKYDSTFLDIIKNLIEQQIIETEQ